MITIREATPIGETEPQLVHLSLRGGRSEWAHRSLPIYPDSPEGEAFRAERCGLVIGLRDAARRCGLTPSQLSGLELGSYVTDADAWAEIRRLVFA